MTHTYVLLEVSPSAYGEVAAKLREAGYHHAFGSDGEMDMHGIALTRGEAIKLIQLKLWRAYVKCYYGLNQMDGIVEEKFYLIQAENVSLARRSAGDVAQERARTDLTLIGIEVVSVATITPPVEFAK